jgi:hypothetical protein
MTYLVLTAILKLSCIKLLHSSWMFLSTCSKIHLVSQTNGILIFLPMKPIWRDWIMAVCWATSYAKSENYWTMTVTYTHNHTVFLNKQSLSWLAIPIQNVRRLYLLTTLSHVNTIHRSTDAPLWLCKRFQNTDNNYQSRWYYVPEYCNLQQKCCE